MINSIYLLILLCLNLYLSYLPGQINLLSFSMTCCNITFLAAVDSFCSRHFVLAKNYKTIKFKESLLI